jgi:hypothetical protein
MDHPLSCAIVIVQGTPLDLIPSIEDKNRTPRSEDLLFLIDFDLICVKGRVLTTHPNIAPPQEDASTVLTLDAVSRDAKREFRVLACGLAHHWPGHPE